MSRQLFGCGSPDLVHCASSERLTGSLSITRVTAFETCWIARLKPLPPLAQRTHRQEQPTCDA